MIIGVGTDRVLYTRSSLSSWSRVDDASVPLIGVAVMRDGTLIGLGKDNRLYTRTALTSRWTFGPESGAVIPIAIAVSGDRIVAVGADGNLYYRVALTGRWVQVKAAAGSTAIAVIPVGTDLIVLGVCNQRLCKITKVGGGWEPADKAESDPIIAIAVTPTGTILAVGADQKLRMREGLTGNWTKPVTNDRSLIAITVMPGGTMLAVADDNQLYSYAAPSGPWTLVGSSDPVIATMAVQLDGTILAVGADRELYTRATLTSSWELVPDGGPLKAITVMRNGTIVGVGLDDRLQTRATLTSSWTSLVAMGPDKPTPVIAITVGLDGTIFGVGADNQLYTLATATGGWTHIPKSGSVTAIAVTLDGIILGVDTGRRLCTFAANTGWTHVPDSGPVKAITVMLDGTILAARPDNQLQTLTALPSTWRVSCWSGGGAAVNAITAMPDGTILAAGSDNKIYKLDQNGWRVVDGSPKVLAITATPDGTIVGVGVSKRQLVYKQPPPADAWATVDGPKLPSGSGSVEVVAITAMPDHGILATDATGLLWRGETVTGPWREVAGGSRGITITAMPDGAFLGVGTDDKQLYMRATLTSGWKRVADGVPMIAACVRSDANSVPLASDWLLSFSSRHPAASDGDGRPWGDGTALARRAQDGRLPWDGGSLVTPFVGGDRALGATRDCFEAAIVEAGVLAAYGLPAGHRGRVYVADWLLHALRDLSDDCPSEGSAWNATKTVARDQTALGMLVRMMAAGITVRVLLWQPTTTQQWQMGHHAGEHLNIAAAIQTYNNTLEKLWGLKEPIGVVALDLRTAAPAAAALHQKMVAIRVGRVNVAFCGGVDLAFTRRDFGRPSDQITGIGDWQSGKTSPPPGGGWPQQSAPPVGGYPTFPRTPSEQFPEDLAANVYGFGNRRWHDQHLKLEGPIVATLEEQFAERWSMDANNRVFPFVPGESIGGDGRVLLTSALAINGRTVAPLPDVQPEPPVGEATVQMWRTIPLRQGRAVPPFARGEFTVMAGVAKAIQRATELITIWDQYFWSTPLALLLAQRVKDNPKLRVIIVLPPYGGSSNTASELKLRKVALRTLWDKLNEASRSRVLVYDMWSRSHNVGIYVHAKVQTYDDALLVCGSANMNRRSLECDAELDCAVMHRPTVRAHLAGLFEAVNGKAWTDFQAGWLVKFWEALKDEHGAALVNDPFYVGTDGPDPRTPNGVPMATDGLLPYEVLEPTSIAGPLRNATGCQIRDCEGDPKSAGRLDQITFLLEHCHEGASWPWRLARDGVPQPFPLV